MKTTTLVLGTTLALSALVGTGCFIEVGAEVPSVYVDTPVPVTRLGDLEVQWTLEGVGWLSQCDRFGVDYFVAEAHGPEFRQVRVDCRGGAWSTGRNFSGLRVGRYQLLVEARDRFGRTLGSMGVDHDVTGSGHLDVYRFEFGASDLLR